MYTKFFKDLSKKDTRIAGGKGASLGEMTGAGIPVPPGFVVLAEAFDHFLAETDLGVEVDAAIKKVDAKNIDSVEAASAKIRDLVRDAEFPEDIGKEIVTQFRKLGARYVAVRSSATAEDSLIASWAGELESYLNVTEKNLLESVKKCWSSLFTPRAIFYRYEKNLADQKVSVAVVVQKMIQSDVSGITFTVHPVTQDRGQMIIESGWGLGEAIVGGKITPDSYVVDKTSLSFPGSRPNGQLAGRVTGESRKKELKILSGSPAMARDDNKEEDSAIIDKNVSEQQMMIVKNRNGAKEVKVPNSKKEKQKLPDKQILEVAALCMKIEAHYRFPQDIEWAIEKNKLYIVQSRPITTL